MALPIGTSKILVIKEQSAQGTFATNTGGQVMNRRSAPFSLKKASYKSQEIRASMQNSMGVHGVRKVESTYGCDLVPGATSAIIQSVLRRDFAAVTALTGLSITIAAGAGGAYTITRATGDFLVSGLRRGMGIRLTAGTFSAINLNNNLVIASMTALVLTVFVANGNTLVAEGPIASATISVTGKVTFVPATGHTNKYWSAEEWFPEVTQSHQYLDNKFGSLDFDLPGSGIAGLSCSVMGRDRSATGTSRYWASPTAATANTAVQSINGVLVIDGTKYVTITDLKIGVNANLTMGKECVGSNLYPDVFNGPISVEGSFGSYFDGATIRDLFANATEVDLLAFVAVSNSKTAEFNSIYSPRILIDTDDYNDETGPVMKTHSFSAGENTVTTAGREATTIQIQDSAAP